MFLIEDDALRPKSNHLPGWRECSPEGRGWRRSRSAKRFSFGCPRHSWIPSAALRNAWGFPESRGRQVDPYSCCPSSRHTYPYPICGLRSQKTSVNFKFLSKPYLWIFIMKLVFLEITILVNTYYITSLLDYFFVKNILGRRMDSIW